MGIWKMDGNSGSWPKNELMPEWTNIPFHVNLKYEPSRPSQRSSRTIEVVSKK
jgi:hypothetical protein